MNNLNNDLYRLDFSEHRGFDQNTNDSDSPSSREDGVDVDSVADTATSVYDFLDEPWEGWTDEQKRAMMKQIYNYTDLIDTAKRAIEEINGCWAKGPILKSQVKKVSLPKNDLCFMYTEKTQRKKVLKMITHFSII